jgi:hypothetical protein
MASPSNLFDISPDALTSNSDNQTNLSDISPDAFMRNNSNNKGISDFERSVSGSKTGTQLGLDFQPTDYSVLFCRGKDSLNHVGNRRFQIVCSMYVERYSWADSKADKSAIVSEIITAIRQAGGNFCKNKKGEWFEVGDQYARGKVSAVMRNMLHNQYRSSNKSKTAIRRALKQSKNQPSGQKLVGGTGDSDDSSLSSSCWGSSNDVLGLQQSPEDFFDIDVF